MKTILMARSGLKLTKTFVLKWALNYVAQMDFKFEILLPLLPESGINRHGPPCVVGFHKDCAVHSFQRPLLGLLFSRSTLLSFIVVMITKIRLGLNSFLLPLPTEC